MTATATVVALVVEHVETGIDSHRDCGVRAGGTAASRRMGCRCHRWRVPRVRGGALRVLVPAVAMCPGCQAALAPVARAWRATFGAIECFARLARFAKACPLLPNRRVSAGTFSTFVLPCAIAGIPLCAMPRRSMVFSWDYVAPSPACPVARLKPWVAFGTFCANVPPAARQMVPRGHDCCIRADLYHCVWLQLARFASSSMSKLTLAAIQRGARPQGRRTQPKKGRLLIKQHHRPR